MNFTELMIFLNSKFQGKKTYTTAIVTILSAALAYFMGELTLFESLQLGVPALMGAFIRHGVKTDSQITTAAVMVSAEISAGRSMEDGFK